MVAVSLGPLPSYFLTQINWSGCKPGTIKLVHSSVTGETAANAIAGVAVATPITRGIAEAEFDALVRDNQQRIYRVLLALLRDPDAAANLTQDCFVKAYQARASFRGEASVSTWLVRIAVNLVRDHQRSKRQGFWRKLFHSQKEDADAQDVMALVADPQLTAEHLLLLRERANAVWVAVEKLSPQQREVFVLRFAEEMSLEEIAQALKLQLGTVKAHLSRALRSVRQQVEERDRG